MDAKDIECIIISQTLLQPSRCEKTYQPRRRTERQRPHRAGHTRGWCNDNQSGDSAGCDSQNTRPTENNPFSKHPAQRSCGSGDLGNCHSHAGKAVSSQCTATVEAKPADPQYARAYDGINQIVGRHGYSRVTSSWSKHQRCNQSGDTCVNVDYSTTGKIKHTHFTKPTPVTPDPMRNWCVDDCKPDSHEPEHGRKFHTFCKCADDDRRRNDGERHLIHHEDDFRDRSGD